jgi:hypothetical protein
MIRVVFGIFLLYWLASVFSQDKANSKPYDYSYYKELTYQELYDFPNDCSKSDEQLRFLRRLQEAKHFNQDPDLLNTADRDYNGRLKATIWWFAYRCDKS